MLDLSQQEVSGSKSDKEIQLDASKTNLVVSDQPLTKEISISSDSALRQAMMRRTLAFDVIGLATFDVMQKWNTRMFELYAQQPAPGFQKLIQAQLLRADRQAFHRIAERFSGSLFGSLESDMSYVSYLLPPSCSCRC